MKLHTVLNTPVGGQFLFRGAVATVVWVDRLEYLIHQGDKQAKEKRDKDDLYFRNTSIFFNVEGLKEGVTLTACTPEPIAKLLDVADYKELPATRT